MVTDLRPGLVEPPRDQVQEIQRVRILTAMVEVAATAGYMGAAVAPVVARAGVSRRTFYELFDGREDCFLAAFDWGAAQARALLVEANHRPGRSWRERVRLALAALLRFLDCEPQLARVLVVEALGASKLVLARRAELLRELIEWLDAQVPMPRSATTEGPMLTAEGVIGGALAVIYGRLLERHNLPADGGPAPSGTEAVGREAVERPPPLIELHGQLMALIVLPYLGARAAGEELTCPAPQDASTHVDRVGGSGGGLLLERLDMRLTYRTVRCLLFVGEHPGASNREVARGAEIPDEGQASKLLGRLVKLDLVANSRPPGPGQPNHWTLTAHGRRVLSAVRHGDKLEV